MNSIVGDPEPEPSTASRARARPRPPDPAVDGSQEEAGFAPALESPSFSDAYKASVPRLVAFLMWQGARYQDAAEIAQEAWTRAYQHWPINKPHAWCRTTASRLYVRRVAAVAEDLVGNFTTINTPLLPATSSAETLAIEIEEGHEALRLLARLPPRQRQVLAWTYDGATPTEIAEVLKITPEAVRASLMKARASLRAYLYEGRGDNR